MAELAGRAQDCLSNGFRPFGLVGANVPNQQDRQVRNDGSIGQIPALEKVDLPLKEVKEAGWPPLSKK